MRELTEEKDLNRDKYLASYIHLSYFQLEVFPKLKNKKEHLFWTWTTHFFLAATQNMMSNLERTIRSTSCLTCEAETCSVLYLVYHMLDADCLQYGNQKLSISGDTCLKYQKQTENIQLYGNL